MPEIKEDLVEGDIDNLVSENAEEETPKKLTRMDKLKAQQEEMRKNLAMMMNKGNSSHDSV